MVFQSCGRYDLLNKLYRNQGEWEKAIAIAKDKDRVHLKNTYYAYAKHLESIGEVRPNSRVPCLNTSQYPKAAEYFERSQTHKFEVPRMYSADPVTLETHVKKSQSKALLKWWGQYMETSQQLPEAVKYYSAAEDTHSLVRVQLFLKQIAKVGGKTLQLAHCAVGQGACGQHW